MAGAIRIGAHDLSVGPLYACKTEEIEMMRKERRRANERKFKRNIVDDRPLYGELVKGTDSRATVIDSIGAI